MINIEKLISLIRKKQHIRDNTKDYDSLLKTYLIQNNFEHDRRGSRNPCDFYVHNNPMPNVKHRCLMNITIHDDWDEHPNKVTIHLLRPVSHIIEISPKDFLKDRKNGYDNFTSLIRRLIVEFTEFEEEKRNAQSIKYEKS